MLTKRELNDFTVYSLDNGKSSIHLIVHPLINRYEMIISDCSVVNSYVAAAGSMASVVNYDESQAIMNQMRIELNKNITLVRRAGFDLEGFDKISNSLSKIVPIKISNKNRLSDIIDQFKSENINR